MTKVQKLRIKRAKLAAKLEKMEQLAASGSHWEIPYGDKIISFVGKIAILDTKISILTEE
ncbi:hypothetical protein N8Z24_00565 [bacterium]|nr:hypothetical protein [bacterium]